MADITIDSGSKAGATEFSVGYRLYGSGLGFTFITPNPTSLPVTVSGLPNGRYETSVSKKCNGVFSVPVLAVSAPCPDYISFGAARDGSSFMISWLLAPGQTVFDIETTSPNGGIQNTRYTDGNTGSRDIPIAPFSEGQWRLRLRGVCDPNATNLFGNWTPYVDITVTNPVACPQLTGAAVTGITATSATITSTIPANSSNIVSYVLQLIKNSDGTSAAFTSSTPTWNPNTLSPNTTYSVYVAANCTNGMVGTPFSGGQFTTGNVPSISLFSQSNSTGSATTTQDFIVGASLQSGNKFQMTVYSHAIIVTASGSDTPLSICNKLKDAINGTTEAQWNDAGSAPASGTPGFKPVASMYSDFQGAHIVVVLNITNSFAAMATYN